MRSLRLGKLFGVDIILHSTFWLLVLYFAVMGLFSGGPMGSLLYLGIGSLVFTIVVMHEFGHIFAARYYGIQTKDIVLTPLGGMARSQGRFKTPTEELVVALAGPMVNFALAGLIYLLSPFALKMEGPAWLPELLGYMLGINLVLGIFNLVPSYPMDGGRVLHAFLSFRNPPLKAMETTVKIGRWAALAIALFSLYQGSIMGVFIAIFISVTAWMELSRMRLAKMQEEGMGLFEQILRGGSSGGFSAGGGFPGGGHFSDSMGTNPFARGNPFEANSPFDEASQGEGAPHVIDAESYRVIKED